MKCAIITGGSRGIGRAICEKLAVDSSYHILINYQNNEQPPKRRLKVFNAWEEQVSCFVLM